MSAGRLRRGVSTAALGAAFAALVVGSAAGQSFADNSGDRDAAMLRDAYLAAPADELGTPLQRQIVSHTGAEPAGTIIIDTAHTFL